MQAAQGALNLYKSGGDLNALTSVDFKFGVGVSATTSETAASSQQASGGYVLAANNLGLYATVGDLTLKGANVSAYDVTLNARRDVVMQSLALTDTVSSSTSSFSAFVGLGASVHADPQSSSGFSADWGIKGSVSDATSQSETVSVSHAQTVVKGANWVTLASGRDTNLLGAEVSGGGITARVAGNLNIVSDQDTERMSASLTSWSLAGTIGLYGSPSSISGSYAKGDAHGDYASVTTTSGLFAGGGGYAVTVGGTTTLTGAALASTADASKNMLTTGALVTKDLTNSMSWKASYWGFSASVSTAGTGGVQPGLSQKTGGSSSGLAQATIAPGTVNIVNAALQKSLTGKTPDQIVAALNRASAAQNKAADKLPGGLAQTLQNQADRSAALTAASSFHGQARGRCRQYVLVVRRPDRRETNERKPDPPAHGGREADARRRAAADGLSGRRRNSAHRAPRRDARGAGQARRRLLPRRGLARRGRCNDRSGTWLSGCQPSAEAPQRRGPG